MQYQVHSQDLETDYGTFPVGDGILVLDREYNYKFHQDTYGYADSRVETDADGNIYLAVRIEEDFIIQGVNVDPVLQEEIMLYKFNSEGNLEWAKRAIGGSGLTIPKISVWNCEIHLISHHGVDCFVGDSLEVPLEQSSELAISFDAEGNYLQHTSSMIKR